MRALLCWTIRGINDVNQSKQRLLYLVTLLLSEGSGKRKHSRFEKKSAPVNHTSILNIKDNKYDT